MKTISLYWACCITLSILLFSVGGCTTLPVEETPRKLVPVNSIGILPAQVAEITILPSDTRSKEQLEAGADILTTLLSKYFSNSQKAQMITVNQLAGLSPSVEAANFLNTARQAGQELDYDAVLITSV